MVELDPIYCDVIAERYRKFNPTGEVYIIRNGKRIEP